MSSKRYSGPLMGLLAVALQATARPMVSTASELGTIQSRQAQINRNLRTYNRVQLALLGYSSGGGLLDIYAVSAVPRKIVATYYGETGQASEEYYFWNGSLCFVLRAENRHDDMFGSVKARSEQRFYFSNGKLLRWINERKAIDVSSTEAQMRCQEVLTSARELLERARPVLKK